MNSSNSSSPNLITKGPSFFDLLEKSWSTLKPHLSLGVGITLGAIIIQMLLIRIPFLGLFLGFLLFPGYILCMNAIRKNQLFDFNQLLWSWQDFNRILQLILLNIVSGLMIFLGLLFFIIPGIYFIVTLVFDRFIFILEKQDAIFSIKKSMELVKNHWWYIHNLYAWLLLLNLLGLLALGIGLLVTVPLTTMILLEAYEALKNHHDVLPPSSTSV